MDTKFFTDGNRIFKAIQSAEVILEDVESKQTIKTKYNEDGSIEGFEPVELKAPPQKNISQIKKSHAGSGRKKGASTTSKYKGVSLHKASGKYRVQVYINGKNTYGGTFDTEEEAAKRADGMFADAGLKKKNFPL